MTHKVCFVEIPLRREPLGRPNNRRHHQIRAPFMANYAGEKVSASKHLQNKKNTDKNPNKKTFLKSKHILFLEEKQ